MEKKKTEEEDEQNQENQYLEGPSEITDLGNNGG